jgi:hypothetical protein
LAVLSTASSQKIYHADPKYGPVYLAKYDIKDGFYRMMIRARDALAPHRHPPKYDGKEQMVAVPSYDHGLDQL